MSTPAALFLHGGYGVFGDVDLQDAWCRRLAHGWATRVVSIDYPLAPEHSLGESVDAARRVMRAVDGDQILVGDSAGAALALATAVTAPKDAPTRLRGILVTNPNVDLTLRRFDEGAPGGPDPSLSARAFAAWTHDWTHSADFVTSAATLPRTFIAVGTEDSVLPEARALAQELASGGQKHELVEYATGHGFLGDATLSDDVMVRARRFFGL